ncbi:MAG: RNA-binding transcriptional accessory protein [Ardenticatenaceae bacterium]|nr:RNA-binding transcriptional accessory protein [Ardenticatenaceae bacterium]
MTYAQQISRTLNVKATQVNAAIELIDAGNTLPFIARYRKEATGSLDDDQLLQIQNHLARLRSLDERRQTILNSITEQGQLTPELQRKIETADTLTDLEDLYQPYKPKRHTRASTAREKGLEPLAQLILKQKQTSEAPEKLAAEFLNDGVSTVEEALAGARDIAAEVISDHAKVRQRVREKAWKWGLLVSEKIRDAEDKRGVYTLYYDYDYSVDRLRPHQILAVNRGETEKILRVHLDIPERDCLLSIQSVFRPDTRQSSLAEQLDLATKDAAKRLLIPAIERDLRRTLTEQAETHAIEVFANNIRGLLTQPPLLGHVVMGVDPAYRTGCKIAIVDATGKVLETATIYPHQPQNHRDEALKTLARLVDRYNVSLIAIGNGTASRETEKLVAELTSRLQRVHYLVVDEAGASVYSASKLAREELPDLDVSLRGAVSIARRVQDPLAELVKIDPKAIGVGLYQHDVNQKQLAETLNQVVELVVNQVGVDVNTASPALLTYVAGIGPKLAEKIVAHRDVHGPFPDRASLIKVHGLGSKAFEQAAGFLRVRDGDNLLDASAIHPESYGVATAVLQYANLTLDNTLEERETALKTLRQQTPLNELARELNTGIPTLQDIFEQLIRPGRDPREDMPAPILRSDVLAMSDLQTGMMLKGTVRNVVDFGCFIDIGVKQDGLLHRSRIPRDEHLNVGDIVQVEILGVDHERERISLGWPQDERESKENERKRNRGAKGRR